MADDVPAAACCEVHKLGKCDAVFTCCDKCPTFFGKPATAATDHQPWCLCGECVALKERGTPIYGWCHKHDERRPCGECMVARQLNRDHIPTVGYDHSLCGADPCSDCR